MSFMSEFREFALKGSVVDLAVGVIIGAAFGRIVDSLVKDVIMPIVNAITGGSVDFSQKYFVLSGSVPPQVVQKLAASETGAAQCGHVSVRRVPHEPQKRDRSEFSASHAGQRMVRSRL